MTTADKSLDACVRTKDNLMKSTYLSGMHGVYLVAAELTRRGLIVSPTLRNALAADLLATDQDCKMTWSVQVKTNTGRTPFGC